MTSGVARKNCVICHKPIEEVGSLSVRGKCQDCAVRRIAANNLQLRYHAGPWYAHWKRQLVSALDGVLLDEVSSEG